MRARPLSGLVWLLAAMLVIVPPGGAVCWPLPNGTHLHIGWSDAAGRMTLGLHVFVHGDAQQIVNLHHPVVTPIVPADTANLSDLRPLAAEALWLLPLITLSWLFLSQVVLRPQSEPAPLEHPPRLSAAF